MFEQLIIGFLLGLMTMLPIFPEKQTFWQWIHSKINPVHRGQKRLVLEASSH